MQRNAAAAADAVRKCASISLELFSLSACGIVSTNTIVTLNDERFLAALLRVRWDKERSTMCFGQIH